nr:retrovirus-related Pol polyprotein from transposon TNT 1-94 [Tanacetum cinerariifolium]
MTKAKGDGVEGLYVRERSGQRNIEQSFVRNEDQVSSSGADGYDNVDVMMAMGNEELSNWIMDSGGSYHITYKRDYLVNFEEEAVRRISDWVKDQYEGNVLDSCNQRSTKQYTKSGVTKHLDVAGIQQQNGLVEETNVTLLAKVRCFLIQSGLSRVFWVEDTTMSTYPVNKVTIISD